MTRKQPVPMRTGDRASRDPTPKEGMMNDSTRVMRRRPRAWPSAAQTATAVIAHRRPGAAGGGLQQRPIIRRFWRLERGKVSELPVSHRLLGLHALPGCTELPRPPRLFQDRSRASAGRSRAAGA
jgi:hypothetical protein